jgi:hypothetical protein
MGYDYYAEAASLAGRLDAEHRNDWAERLRAAIAEGSTATEILMGLRRHLQRLRDSGVTLSDGSKYHLDELLRELQRALA